MMTNITLTQIVLTLFLLFALSRVVLRFKGGALTITGFIFWSGLFCFAIVVVIIPSVTSLIANAVGIRRGADAVIYTSLVLLFYLIFRLHIFIEDIKHEISELVRKLAFEELKKRHAKKTSKN